MNHAQLIRIQGESQVNVPSNLHVFIWRLLIFKRRSLPQARPLLSTSQRRPGTSIAAYSRLAA
jgi:hypothetical protein